MIKTVIVTTGDELLHGTTTDTNSAFISWCLFGTDINVLKHYTVGDDIDSIISAIDEALLSADLVIMTGGLGPTDDDNTVEAVCKIFNRNIITDVHSEKRMKDFFESMKISINNNDYKMASVPGDSLVLKNMKGLAPGFIIEEKNKTLIALPGVPSEVEKIFDEEVLPYLQKRYNYYTGNRIMLKLTGIRESDINTRINTLMFDSKIKWGISAKSGICDLCFISRESGFPDKIKIISILNNEFKNYIIGEGFNSPEDELISILKQKQLTISTAESCTGGLIGKRFTDISGASEVFYGSVTAYSNSIKKDVLGVKESTISKYGAVSEETAAEMVFGICRLFNTDIGISVTGIAGPGGGTKEKPVGTVCFGFHINNEVITRKEFFNGDRDRIRIFSSLYAINFIRKHLLEL
jgi:nicotinamide-nucleotide amidase